MTRWDDLLVRDPVNAMARRVVRQGKEVAPDSLSRPELIALLERITRKQKLLKVALGIKTHAQHVNAMYKFNRGIGQFRMKQNPRAFIEYKRLGEQAQRFLVQLKVLKDERRREYLLEKELRCNEDRS